MHHNKQNNTAGMGAQIGSASIVMIFAVLCLTIFATLSFQTAAHEYRLAQKTADAAEAYYRADGIAEERYGQICAVLLEEPMHDDIGARLDAMHVQQERIAGAQYLQYRVPVDDTQALEVVLLWTERVVSIVKWRVVATTQWEYDELLPVWDGTMTEVE